MITMIIAVSFLILLLQWEMVLCRREVMLPRETAPGSICMCRRPLSQTSITMEGRNSTCSMVTEHISGCLVLKFLSPLLQISSNGVAV